MQKIKPRNWDRFQHYKNRNPPWIKLYIDLLVDFKFTSMSLGARGLACSIWMLASREQDASIELAPTKLAHVLHCNTKDVEKYIDELKQSGLFDILQDASAVLADCKQDASNMLDRVEESRDRGETETEKRREDICRANSTGLFGDEELQSFVPATIERHRPTSIEQVIEQYKHFHPKAVPGQKERKLISDRIKEGYSIEDLCLAIRNHHGSPYHLGDNDRGRQYLSLELCMRDSKHVTMFIEMNPETEQERREWSLMSDTAKANAMTLARAIAEGPPDLQRETYGDE